MSLKATPVPRVPEETARVAGAAFGKRKGKGSPWIALRDELGSLYEDSDFSALFAIEGRPAKALAIGSGDLFSIRRRSIRPPGG